MMERTFTLLFGAWLCLLVACGSKGTGASGPAKADSVMAYRICSSSGWDTLFIRPVMGYRFSIRGDFDGDGKTELLTEHYVDSNGQETNKFYWGMLDYDDLVDRINKRNLRSYLLSDNAGIDTLHIGGGLGLSLLRNEGDLNGDGNDEISYVGNWADWSSLNSCDIYTYRNGHWEELYAIDMWEWQLPDLPETYSNFGLFGLMNIEVHTGYDSINQLMEKELKDFPGFVLAKLGGGRIKIRYRNEEANEDTMEVDLNQP